MHLYFIVDFDPLSNTDWLFLHLMCYASIKFSNDTARQAIGSRDEIPSKIIPAWQHLYNDTVTWGPFY